MTVFCDNYGCIFIDECGFCDCDNLNIVGGVCDGSYHNDKNATEQAIATTLGRPKAKSHPYGYERDTGAYDCTRCECGCINDISATYCNDCGGKIEIDESAEKEYYDGYSEHTVLAKKHDDGSLEFCERRYVPATLSNGTLTAEHVREAIFNNSSYASYDGVKYYADGISMQAVADEVNTHVDRTCNLIEDGDLLHCSNCGGAAEKQSWAYWNYCPNCRIRVIK